MNRGFRGFPLKRPVPTSYNGLKEGFDYGFRGFPTNQVMTDAEFNARMILSLQSYSRSFFKIAGTNIDQWSDIGPLGNHATATGTTRPAYSTLDISFDGTTDFFTLNNEIQLPEDFSIYIVYKKNSLVNPKILFGSSVAPDIYYQVNINQTITIQHTASSEGANIYTQGGLTMWNVLSIRRTSGAYKLICNDRQLVENSIGLVGTPLTRIGLIGKRIAGASIDGHMRAFCVADKYFDDALDERARNYLLSKYGLPDQVALIGLGDSITFQDTWFTDLGVSLGLPSVNVGVSGSFLSYVGNNAPQGTTQSMRVRLLTQVISRPYIDKVTILGGTNDLINGVSATVFGSNLSQILNILINTGYNCRNICVGSTPYQTGNANAATLDAYRTEVILAAAVFNARYVDILQEMRDNGGDALMADALHPNASGGIVIHDAFEAGFTGP